jgi:hypothetical protein
MGEMGKGEMETAHAGKPPSLPRELRTPLVLFKSRFSHFLCSQNDKFGYKIVYGWSLIEMKYQMHSTCDPKTEPKVMKSNTVLYTISMIITIA